MSEISELKSKIDSLQNTIDLLLKKIAPEDNCIYTLYGWLDEWLEIYKKPYIKPKSYKTIEQCIRIHIKGHIVDIKLNKVTAIAIQQALNAIPSTRMRKYTFDCYHGAFLQAERLELIDKNPMINVLPVKHVRKTGRALSVSEQEDFLHIIKGNKLEKLYLFYLYSGCRLSEAFPIAKNDVDFEKKLIHIKGTKTDKSDRYIPLHKQLEKLILSINTTDLLFPYNANIVACNFKRLKKKYNLKYTIHSLRHTYATRCLENGVSMKVVQKWLGHSKLDTTANVYMHVQTDFEQQEILKIKF